MMVKWLVCVENCLWDVCWQLKTDSEHEEVDIATCTRGQYFGELALVTNKPRAASAYAVENVKCLGKTTDFK